MHSYCRAIVGYGELGKQISSMLPPLQNNDSLVIFDDIQLKKNNSDLKKENFKAIVYPFQSYNSDEFKEFEFYICIGYKHLLMRQSIISELLDLRRSLPSLIHSSVTLLPTALIESGCFIYPGSIIGENTKIKKGTILNYGVNISHDVEIGESAYLCPGVIVCGNTKISSRTFIGAGSILKDNITIAEDVRIGMGTTVTKSLEASKIAIGNPMKYLSNPFKL